MQQLAFLTQHHKLSAVAKALSEVGFQVFETHGLDTDTLGTFSGEVARKTTQLKTAETKAKLATDCALSRYGLGSEGSFGPDPFMGVTAWGVEILVLWDAQEEHAVHAVAQGPQTNYDQAKVTSWKQAQEFAALAGFPAHGIIVGQAGDDFFDKNIDCSASFEARVLQGLKQGAVWLETDMRAHRNPTRMAMIAKAAEALAINLAKKCPQCSAPGFCAHSLLSGAVCSACHRPTSSARAQVLRCNQCDCVQEEQIRTHVAPDKCEHCNP